MCLLTQLLAWKKRLQPERRQLKRRKWSLYILDCPQHHHHHVQHQPEATLHQVTACHLQLPALHAPDNAEVRIKQRVKCEISANACSKQNFGWLLTQTIYKKEVLYGRNVFGNRKNIIAISPRRRHALKHAVAEVYGLFDANWKEAVNGINTGLRVMRRRLPFTAVDGNSQWKSIRKNPCELFCVFVYTLYMHWLNLHVQSIYCKFKMTYV